MKRFHLAAGAGLVAAALALTACGSSGSSSTATGGSAPAASGNTIASTLTFGGPATFKTRSYGVEGLQKNYGVTFGKFTVLDTGGPLSVNALKGGQVQAADIFTTDPTIKANDFVVLDDPKNNFAAQNVLPVITKSKVTPGIQATLKAVDDVLTTDDLIALNTAVSGDAKEDPAKAAADWLKSKGLDATGTQASGVSLTVGSADFPESQTVAEIYILALQAQGATITPKLGIGSREVYIPALQDGSIDLIPDYSGNLLTYFKSDATQTSSDDVFTALQSALPSTLQALDQSQAQDKDAVVVTKATADKYGLTSIADLAKSS